MKKKHVVLLVLVLLGAVVFWYAWSRFSVPVVTEIERELDPLVFRDFVEDTTLETTYAENITFANASVRRYPGNEDRLLVDLDVTNNGDKTVTYLYVYVEFYNRDGRKAAEEAELLGTDNHINDAPIPPGSSKRATIVLASREDWTGGKIVVKIRQFETE